MMLTKETIYSKDASGKKLKVERVFDAPVEQVWKAWTQSDLLDQWWAPKPWKANTKSMDFREGGRWLYYMEGPDGSRHHCILNYKTIDTNKSFRGVDGFTDENGNLNTDMPSMDWTCVFIPVGNTTRIEMEITFASEADLEKIVEMGFKEGFAAAHTNLDELLANQ
ncbi:SRPBCC family protein [Longitalea arenae]|uniref:SRPBCC family protein n=1 Tax=Longitalea arenae TaxID=2812558 RepID=UPI001967181B|nr:SRPBCC domain-containing protein [Longitalea arenae]